MISRLLLLLSIGLAGASIDDPCRKLCDMDPDSTCRFYGPSSTMAGAFCFGYYYQTEERYVNYCFYTPMFDNGCRNDGMPVTPEDARSLVSALRRGPSPIFSASPVQDADTTLSIMIREALENTDAVQSSQLAQNVLQTVRAAVAEPVLTLRGHRVLRHSYDRWFELGGSALAKAAAKVVPWHSFAEKFIFKAYIELVTTLEVRSPSLRNFLELSGFRSMCESEPHKLLWLVTNDVTEWGERDLINFSPKTYLRNNRLFKYCPKIFASDSTARSLLYLDRLNEWLVNTASLPNEGYMFMKLDIPRQYVLKRSFEQLVNYHPSPRSHLDIGFLRESVYGHGAVKEWFTIISQRMSHAFFVDLPQGLVFKNSRADRMNWALEMMCIGQVLALSVRERVPMGLKMPMTYYAFLMGREVTLADYEKEQPALFKSYSDILKWDLSSPIYSDLLSLEFGDKTVTLTEQNKAEMISKKLNYPPLMDYEKSALIKVRDGFNSILVSQFLNRDEILSPSVLRDVTAGQSLSIEEFRNDVSFSDGYSLDSPQVEWLIEMLEEFNDQQRAEFFKFVTALPRLPLGGLKRLDIPFTIKRADYVPGVLISSRTCFNLLILPEYPSPDLLRAAYMDSLAQALTMEE